MRNIKISNGQLRYSRASPYNKNQLALTPAGEQTFSWYSTHEIVCYQTRWFVGRNLSRELNAVFGRSAKLGLVLFWMELPWGFRGCSIWSKSIIPHTETAIEEYCSDPIIRAIGCHNIMSTIGRNPSGRVFQHVAANAEYHWSGLISRVADMTNIQRPRLSLV